VRILPRGIRRKLLWLLLLAGVVPLAVFGAAAIESSRSVTDELVRASNLQIAQRAAQAVELHVDGVLAALAALADTLGRAGRTPAERQQALLAARARVRAFAILTVVDREGAVVASTADPPPAIPADDDALSAGRAGQRHLGRVTLGERLVPRVRAALPVMTLGSVDAVLIADLDLVEIWRVVDGIRVGRTGHALVLDGDGRLIADGDPAGKALVIRHEPVSDLVALARAAAAHGGLAEGRGSSSAIVVSAAVPIAGTPWTFILEQEADETFAYSRRLTGLLAAFALGAAVLTLAIGARLARRSFLEPLRRLVEAAELFKQRRFEHRVDLATGDELERFGRTLEEMAAALARAYDDLARTERAQAFGILAAGLAHDLKHPIADLQAVLMRARGRDGPDVDALLASAARRAVPRLTRMIEQLRDLGRAGQRHDTEFGATALFEILDGFAARADEKGVTLESRPPGRPLTIVADGMLVSRALENLVANAVEATPAGGRVVLAIDAASARELEIRVRDTGPGIPPAIAADLLRPFATDAPGGLGLGLYVVQRVVEAHDGELRVGRLPEGGAELVLRLPVIVA
jgi:signal transduction histidine kinase